MTYARPVRSASDAAPADRGGRLGRLALAHPAAVIVAAALLIWAPTLLIDFGRGDSLDENLTWSIQFSQLFAHGHLYPRWLPASFDGLGSPAFDYYPPLPFWVTALISPFAAPMMALKLSALAALVLSGVTMRLWLKGLCAPPRALICALIYMAAPYHLIDHYVRGAFAEFFALGMIPLVMLGLAMTARRSRFGPPVLAAGYGLLLVSHLPMALIVSVMLIAPYGLFLLWRQDGGRLSFVLSAAAGLALGAGVAAIYLAPALGLEDAISADYLWRLKPGDHLFTSGRAWANPFEPLLAAMSVIEAAFAGLLGWSAWRGRATPAVWPAVFWAALSVAVFAALSGLVPGFWSLPTLSKVQFAWRAMGAEEFALVTALALSPWADVKRLAGFFAVLTLANPGLAADIGSLAQGRPDTHLLPAGYVEAIARSPRDAPEYLPRGMLRMQGGEPVPAVPLDALTALPLAAPALSASADPITGAVTLRPAPGGQRIVLRRFAHPGWGALCDGRAVAVGADGPGRLVSFVAPAGAQSCTAQVGPTALETLGDWVALASLAALLGYLAWALTAPRRRPTDAAVAPVAGA